MLKQKLPLLIGGFLAVLVVVGAIGAGIAYADNSTPPAPTNGQMADGRGPHGGHMLGQAELEAAAQALGMTTDELSTALKNGQTLEQIAASKGVDFSKVQAAIQSAHRDEMRTQIQQAVKDGTITQDKANWLLEGLDKGYLDQPGLGLGFGRGPGAPGGPNGNGYGQPPAGQPTPTTTH